MAWAEKNFKTKKALKEAIHEGPVPCYQPGPFGPRLPNGTCVIEGPHERHKWYAQVMVRGNHAVKFLG
jgi:hypothetical protein